jgi:hypothetical protein
MADKTPFVKVNAGDPINPPSASEHNATLDAVAWVQAQHHNQGHGRTLRHRDAAIVKVKNSTGSARSRFDVVALTSPMFDPATSAEAFTEAPRFTGTKPAIPGDVNRCAILQEPCAEGAAVDAVILGASVATVDVKDADHEWATPVDDAYTLESAKEGPLRILWKAGTSGPQLALVVLGAAPAPATSLFELQEVWHDHSATNPPVATAYLLYKDDLGAIVTDTETTYSLFNCRALRGPAGYFGLPEGRIGQHIHAAYNVDTDRWEVVGSVPQLTYWAYSATDITDDDYANAVDLTLEALPTVQVPATFRCPIGGTIPANTRLLITWFEDEGGFYVTGGCCSPPPT